MSRSVSTFVLLSILLAAGAVPAVGQSPTILLADDFASGSLLGWSPSPLGLAAGWSACAGTAAYDGGGHTQIYRGSSAWTDYTVAAKVQVAAAEDFPGGLRGRLDTASGASYAAWIYPGQGKVKLFRAVAWNIDTTGLALLGEASVSIGANVFHDLALTFAGTRIQVAWNGATVIDVTDSGSSALSAGAVAFDVSNKAIEFDDVSVTAGGTAPRPLRGRLLRRPRRLDALPSGAVHELERRLRHGLLQRRRPHPDLCRGATSGPTTG